MKSLMIQTPAKINTRLYIIQKRADGYHDLVMHMLPVNLFDRLRFEASQEEGVRLVLSGRPCGSAQDNLILKAAQMFADQTGSRLNWTIHLEKRIPVQAGLGGGSGNAAGTLVALNHLMGTPLSEPQLRDLALKLGADVPFFIQPRPSLAQGLGEQLTPLPGHPTLPLVIIKPELNISTAQAYRQCHPSLLANLPEPPQTIEDVGHGLRNQFEASLLPQFPQLAEIKERLKNVGALAALVSGSGSAVFGVFASQQEQQRAARELSSETLGECFVCETISQHTYV